MPLYSVAGTPFEAIRPLAAPEVTRIRSEAAKHLPQMHHCTRCRADAAGLLGEPMSSERLGLLRQSAALPLDPAENRPYVAVGTREGVLLNQHFGEAKELSVFRKTANGFELVDRRSTPPPGGGARRWHDERAIERFQDLAAQEDTIEDRYYLGLCYFDLAKLRRVPSERIEQCQLALSILEPLASQDVVLARSGP